ncbi:MAG: hypothetical protein QM731_05485 [Chitinophagaceae bacterium]
MKKNFFNAILFAFVTGLLLSACQKNYTESETADPELIQKVTAWLDKQEQKFKDSINKSVITSLKANLLISEISTAALSDKQRVVVIPLKKEFNTNNITRRESFKNLAIIQDENGELQLSNIVEVIPEGQQFKTIAASLIADVFSNRDNVLNGTVSILSLTNKFIEERAYKEGKLATIKHLKMKSPSGEERNSGSLKTNECIEWYLVTTYYWSDGSYTQTWTYLFTSCEDCALARTMDSADSFKLNCSGGGGGGAGSYEEVVEEVDFEEDEPNYTDADYNELGSFVRTRYRYHAQVRYYGGEIVGVIIDPITASPMYVNYIDNYNRDVTRTLTLLGHSNYYEVSASRTNVYIKWRCLVNARYVYTNGGVFTNQWEVSKSQYR